MEPDGRRAVAELFPKHQAGDRSASKALEPLIDEGLRRIARDEVGANARIGHLVGTPPLSVLYTRLAGDCGVQPPDQPAFLLLCATSMRRAVVEFMQRRRGPALESSSSAVPGPRIRPVADLVVAVDEILDAVERFNSRLARLVECRYFAGLTEEETAAALRTQVIAVERDWTRARTWLRKELNVPSSSKASRDVTMANAAWVDAVFDDALALPAEERHGFLDHWSAAPAGLRTDVEELLRLAAETPPGLAPGDLGPALLWSVLTGVDFLEADVPDADPSKGDLTLATALELPVTPAVTVTVHAEPERGTHAGVWRIIRELRRDALGPRYLVESDRNAGQKGALLWIGRAAAGAGSRLRYEWRVLSSLTHEGIARFLDTGQTGDGRVYVVMEHVEGREIHHYCDEELLTVDRRLDLFLRVCVAVQHAHRRLVVHGGITPSSVVVTADGTVKLLDFGIAGLLARVAADEESPAPVSATSPEYASPEQVRGEAVLVASDVYQLGLLLYELLTGEKAQAPANASAAAVEQAVCVTPAMRPSLRVHSAPERVAASRRLRPRGLIRKLRGDVDAVLLQALRKEPDRRYPSVSALRSDVQRIRMTLPVWAQPDTWRYRFRKFLARRRLALTGAAVVILAAAVLLPGLVDQRLSAARERARAAHAETLLEGMFARDGAAASQPLDAMRFVEQATAIARTQLAGEPVTRGRLLTTIGRAFASLGHDDRAIDVLEEALILRRTAFGEASSEVGDTLGALGRSLHTLGRYDEAETSLRTVVAIHQLRGGTGDPRSIGSTLDLGALLHTRGQLVQAEQVLRSAVTGLRPEVVRAGHDPGAEQLLPRALRVLGSVLRDRGVLGESAALYREAIDLLGRQGAGLEPLRASAQADLARLLVARAELDRADGLLAEAVPALRRVYGPRHPEVAAALRDYGYLRLEQGRLDEAADMLAEAEQVQEERLGRMHPMVPGTRALQAELARRGGHLPEAIALARQTLEELGRLEMHDHPSTIELRATLGEALMAAGEHEDALRVLAPAVSSAERLFVSYDPRISRLQSAMTRATNGRGIRGSAR